jgi:hypothetical protein
MTRRAAMFAATVVVVMMMVVGPAGVGVGGTPVGGAAIWQPRPGLRWQYQLQGAANTAICAKPVQGGACVHPDVFVIDFFADDGTTPNSTAVARIHARHAHAVCYVDAGTWENWRPDAARYPAKVRGKSNGWPGERWLDIRAVNVLQPLIGARVAQCAKAGFDAVDFDNVDGYANDTGFPLTGAQQLAFNRMLARVAHAHSLAVGLKNDVGQLAALRTSFNFAVNEQCFTYHECNGYDAWTKTGRAVVEIEYRGKASQFCGAAGTGRRDAMHKELALKASPWVPCR